MSGTTAAAAPAAQTPFYQLYRRSSYVSTLSRWGCKGLQGWSHLDLYRLGNALVEALDELINSGHINPQLALQTLAQVSLPLSSVESSVMLLTSQSLTSDFSYSSTSLLLKQSTKKSRTSQPSKPIWTLIDYVTRLV